MQPHEEEKLTRLETAVKTLEKLLHERREQPPMIYISGDERAAKACESSVPTFRELMSTQKIKPVICKGKRLWKVRDLENLKKADKNFIFRFPKTKEKTDKTSTHPSKK
jgi:hypothetical protein